MDDHDKKIKGLTKKLAGLQQCVAEIETSGADLMMAMGADPEEFGHPDADRLSSEIEHFLFVLANSVEARERHTHGHIERVVILATALGRSLALGEEDIRATKLGGVLHDIGKIGLPGHLLDNTGRLTPEEFEPIKNHPEIGYQICLPLNTYLGRALDVIRQHHEKLDGSGYPHDLKGDDIYVGTRIMTVVDIYDALMSDRPYRKGLSQETALAILHQEAADGKIDTGVVDALDAFLRT